MDTIENNLKHFTGQSWEIYDAYENYGKLMHYKGDLLDEKTRWLIKVALICSMPI